MADFVGAIDQGTTSTRFMVFDHGGNEIARHQLEHEQVMPQPGWVEHRPAELWERTCAVVRGGLRAAGLAAADLAAVGITNQRETTLVWDRRTGAPYGNAIVWQDTRTAAIAAALDRDGRGQVIRDRAGLPPSAYFSAGKIQWILQHADGARAAAEAGRAVFGTVDSWLLWQLTGGADGGVHVTDPTNASRTMLMDLDTLDWDEELLSFFGIPRAMLPQIRPSADPHGYGATRRDGPFGGEVLLAGDLGDQQAAMVGQACLAPGEAKSTYGTGSFLLQNVGGRPVRSAARAADHRLLPVRRRAAGLRAGGLDRLHRLGGPVAAGPAGPDLRRRAERGTGPAGRRQRRRVLRARVLRPARPVLAAGRARRHRGPVPLQHQRAPGPGHPGVHLLPDPRCRRRDEPGLRGDDGRAARRRRRHRQRPVHAAPGRHPRGAGLAARSSPRPPRWAPPTRPAWPPASGRRRTSCGATGRRAGAGTPAGTTTSAPAATPAGARPWTAPSAGSTSADPAGRAARGLGGRPGSSRLRACPEQARAAGITTVICGPP